MPAPVAVYITFNFDENIEKVSYGGTNWVSSGERHLITPIPGKGVTFTIYPKAGYATDTVNGKTIENNSFTEVYISDVDTSYAITSKKSGGVAV